MVSFKANSSRWNVGKLTRGLQRTSETESNSNSKVITDWFNLQIRNVALKENNQKIHNKIPQLTQLDRCHKKQKKLIQN